MQAWRVYENGEPSAVMRREEVEPPAPGDGQVLLKVRAANVNFPDALLCRGHYQVRPPLPFTPGVEVCAETEDGRRVITTAALPHGGFAEYTLADAAGLLPAPEALDDAEAAALHIGYQTGWFGLHRRAALQEGEPAASAAPPSSSARRPAPPSSASSAARRRRPSPAPSAATR